MFPPRIGVIPLTHETGQGCDLLICLEPAARLARTERRDRRFYGDGMVVVLLI